MAEEQPHRPRYARRRTVYAAVEMISSYLKAHRAFLKRLVYLGTAVGLYGSITPYIPASVLITDIPSHFTLHYIIGTAFLIALSLILRVHKIIFAAQAVVILICTITLLPYLIPAATAAPDEKSFKILQANTLYLNKNPQALEHLIAVEKPDIIALSEVNSAFAQMLSGLKEEYPYQLVEPKDHDARGLALLSRHPTSGMETISFADVYVPAQLAQISIGTAELVLASVHPRTPLHGLDLRDADFAVMADRFAQIATDKTPFIITGDFNATPFCPALRKLKRNLNLSDARRGYGLQQTWPVWLPAPLRIPIDHVLVSRGVSVLDYRLGPSVGSDHLPTIAVLGLADQP
ncbi:MAG: endonuclease/exonuclease/phosphatase family protein [Parvibaculum sp.]|uniref:endonuclease/exonuclease/phosphatase family protein n=1 Tax=Parvibaculum sp. TaxID=2024848 RepID=UPI0027304756|nr:endonuclease/exonuclease/phosphatase family protein [Parvibaculum sp.]MDP2148833.1 endonuclease/exonuclease/phosphatase family protein [Parvibaculum sp.]